MTVKTLLICGPAMSFDSTARPGYFQTDFASHHTSISFNALQLGQYQYSFSNFNNTLHLSHIMLVLLHMIHTLHTPDYY